MKGVVMKRCVAAVSVVFLFVLLALGIWLWSGQVSVAADEPHDPWVFRLLEWVRERSIVRAAQGIAVPSDLDAPQRLLRGGADYREMCAGCHLAPGIAESDFTVGLYPAPPNLAKLRPSLQGLSIVESARRDFWIIKHGIKASGMPAWGKTHDDERIWNMVAFLKRLPELDANQYRILTTR